MASQDICAESQSGCAQSEKSHRFCDDMAATGAESQNSVMVITRSVTRKVITETFFAWPGSPTATATSQLATRFQIFTLASPHRRHNSADKRMGAAWSFLCCERSVGDDARIHEPLMKAPNAVVAGGEAIAIGQHGPLNVRLISAFGHRQKVHYALTRLTRPCNAFS